MCTSEQASPVVLRFQGLWPENLSGFEKHRKRGGGDLGHIDPALSPANRRLLGQADWAQSLWDDIEDMRLGNFVKELASLKKRRRKKDLERRLAEGPQDPWRATRHGPLREVILTVNAKWFERTLDGFWGDLGMSREDVFEFLSKQWLVENFGEDCRHASADVDEKAYHIHAVIAARKVTPDGRHMLQPSARKLIKNYEKAQDSVGKFFGEAGIDLTRGVRRKQALRNALEHNRMVRAAMKDGTATKDDLVELPEYRQHVSPRKWREQQEIELAERDIAQAAKERGLREREDALAGRETAADKKHAEAVTVLGIAEGVAEGRVDVLTGDDEPGTGLVGKARAVFGKAIDRLRASARTEAREELSDAFDQIRAADDAIVEIARTLPDGLRDRVVKARKGLTRSIVGLTRKSREWLGRPNPDEPRE